MFTSLFSNGMHPIDCANNKYSGNIILIVIVLSLLYLLFAISPSFADDCTGQDIPYPNIYNSFGVKFLGVDTSNTNLGRFYISIDYEGTALPHDIFIAYLYVGNSLISSASEGEYQHSDTLHVTGSLELDTTISIAVYDPYLEFKLELITKNYQLSYHTCEYIQREWIGLIQPYAFGIPEAYEQVVNDPVNVINGNMFIVRTDYSINSDAGSPIVFNRYYNSYTPTTPDRPFEMWRHSYQYDLQVFTLNPPCDTCNVIITEPTGRGIFFRRMEEYDTTLQQYVDVFIPPSGNHYNLTYDAINDIYTMTDANNIDITFEYINSEYRATLLTDLNDNEIELEYTDGLLTQIKGVNNRTLNLEYEEITAYHLLERLADDADSVLVTYAYDDDYFLDTVYYDLNTFEAYFPGTDTENELRIIKSENSDGYTWYFDYNDDHLIDAAYNDGTIGAPVERVDIDYSMELIANSHWVSYQSVVTANDNSDHKLVYTSFWHPEYDQTFLYEVRDSSCEDCYKLIAYDEDGNRNMVRYPNGRIDTYKYDDRGNVVSYTKGSGWADSIATAYEYDMDFNLLTKIVSPSAQNSSGTSEIWFERDDSGNVDSLIEKGWLNDTTSYEYKTSYTYKDNGQVLKIDGPRTSVDDTIAFGYYPAQSIYDSTSLNYIFFPNGDTITYGPPDLNSATTPYVIDANGIKTSFEYDLRNRVRQITEVDQTTMSGDTYIDYDFEGNITHIQYPLGDTIGFAYDSHNWLTSMRNQSGEYLSFDYDENSKVSTVQNYTVDSILRMENEYIYNWKAQLEKVAINAQNDGIEYVYNPMSTVKYILTPSATIEDEMDSTIFEYDLFNRLTTKTQVQVTDDTLPNIHSITEYEYDLNNNLTKIIDPEDYEAIFDYDDHGNLIYNSSGMTGVTTYVYDEAGNLITKSDANGNEISYTYDNMNRLETIDYSDNTLDVTYTYDSSASTYGRGRLSREEKQGESIDYDYNPYGLVNKETHTYSSESYSITYGYNKNKELSYIIYPSGIRYNYEYDDNRNVNKITSRYGTGAINTIIDSIYYEPFGDMKRIVYGNGIKTDFVFNQRYLMDGISSGADDIVRRSYTYDTVGNVKSYFDSLSDKSTAYKYDNKGQLIQATSGEYASSANPMNYAYYKNGNRDSTSRGVMPATFYNYDTGSNRLSYLSGVSYPDTAWYGYDDNGNVTSISEGLSSIALTFDQNNCLVSYTDTSSTYDYSFNTRLQRNHTSVGSTETSYIYSLNGFMLEDYIDDDWNFDYIYLNGQPIAKVWAVNTCSDTSVDTLIDPPIESMGASTMSIGDPPPPYTDSTHWNIYYFHNDHLGTPLALTDSNKTVCWKSNYYPFGEVFTEYASTLNNIRFPGQLHDRETNNHYNMFRTYDPTLGRYLSADPIGSAGGINYYSYAGNNPINRIDPFGLDWYEMINGDLIWFDKKPNLPGCKLHSKKLYYYFTEDDGSQTKEYINPVKHNVIPNVTYDIQQRMTWAKNYGIGLFTSTNGLTKYLGMVLGYYSHMPFDIKRKKPYSNHTYVRLFGKVMRKDDPGNILFGYGAAAAGFSLIEAWSGAGVVQIISDKLDGLPIRNSKTGDQLKDQEWIEYGYHLY